MFFQDVTRKLVMEHRKDEELAGHDIWPATPKHNPTNKSKEEIDFCAGLDGGTGCCKGAGEELDW